MHHVMFDIDGTLIQSYNLDSDCFVSAVKEVTGLIIDSDWAQYQHVTDAGILNEIIATNKLCDGADIHRKVKAAFVEKITQQIKRHPVQEIPGASSILALLNSMDNVVVSVATGGWYESAILKLRSAGMNLSGLTIASSNDHYERAEIMRTAASRITGNTAIPCTYFGDGCWDRDASLKLGYKFVLVGDRFKHDCSIGNFNSHSDVMACIGL